ncbi:MAG TPA: hypothetical protein VLA04_05385 [Verrucomicrobiae bacterium]|nr:hypothetical protein [Verrucomicrobiae bacterium]
MLVNTKTNKPLTIVDVLWIVTRIGISTLVLNLLGFNLSYLQVVIITVIGTVSLTHPLFNEKGEWMPRSKRDAWSA